MSSMTILERIGPGDAAAAQLAVVALGVALLTTAAVLAARLRWLSRRPSPRHALLFGALAGCLAMPVLAGLVAAAGLAIAVPVLPASETVAVRDPAPAPAAESLAGAAPITPLPSSSGPGEAARAVAVTTVGDRAEVRSPYRAAIGIALGVWGLGTLILLARLARGVWLARSLRLSARPCDEPALGAVLDRMAPPVGGGSRRRMRWPWLTRSPDGAGSYGLVCSGDPSRGPEVLVAPGLATPVVVGIVRPEVILPEGLAGSISAEELRDVLLHELAHARRRDPLVVLLQGIARALYWPIAPVHVLNRELERAREELCDNHVVQERDPLSYGETLLHLAELATGRDAGRLGASAGILHWRGKLESRIAGLLDAGRSTATRTPRALACGLLLLSLGTGTLAASLRLVARADEAKPQPQPPDAAATKPEPPKPEGRSILVKALDPDGKPMPGVAIEANITARPTYEGETRFVTDARGEVRIALPGGISDFDLRARADHCVPLLAKWEGVDGPPAVIVRTTVLDFIAADGTISKGKIAPPAEADGPLPAEFTFRMDRGVAIGGMVRDPEGRPIEGARVEVTRIPRPEEMKIRPIPDFAIAAGEGAPRTDANGRWSLDGAPAERLEVMPIHRDYAIGENHDGTMTLTAVAKPEDLRSQAAVTTMQRSVVVRGTVTDPDGKPVPGAVIIPNTVSLVSYPEDQTTKADGQGRFALNPQAHGTLTLAVIGEGWMPVAKKVELKVGQPPVEIRLGRGKDLRLRFVDAAGKPIPDVDVNVNVWRGRNWLYNGKAGGRPDTKIPSRADADGRYRWSWAPDDPVQYFVHKEGYSGSSVTLTADGREHTVVLREEPATRTR